MTDRPSLVFPSPARPRLLNTIEYNVGEVQTTTKAAAEELVVARKHQKAKNKKKLWCMLICVLILVAAAAAIIVPLGNKLGWFKSGSGKSAARRTVTTATDAGAPALGDAAITVGKTAETAGGAGGGLEGRTARNAEHGGSLRGAIRDTAPIVEEWNERRGRG
jgi:hypothetical protein